MIVIFRITDPLCKSTSQGCKAKWLHTCRSVSWLLMPWLITSPRSSAAKMLTIYGTFDAVVMSLNCQIGRWNKMSCHSYRCCNMDTCYHSHCYLFHCNTILDYDTDTNVCTCHDSTAVVSYAKLWSDQLIQNWIKKWNCNQIRNMGSFRDKIPDINLNKGVSVMRGSVLPVNGYFCMHYTVFNNADIKMCIFQHVTVVTMQKGITRLPHFHLRSPWGPSH